MIQVTPQMRILLAVEPVDFRLGIDGLSRICRERLEQDPFRGAVFVFRNRRGKGLRVFTFDGQGFWLCYKRMSSGRFRWWPAVGEKVTQLTAHQLQVLLWCGDPAGARAAPEWRRVEPSG